MSDIELDQERNNISTKYIDLYLNSIDDLARYHKHRYNPDERIYNYSNEIERICLRAQKRN